jgi:hypothetical protein
LIPGTSGLVPGRDKVSINAGSKNGERTKPASPSGARGVPPSKELIPVQYNARTKLTYEVKSGGPNEVDFQLESP